MGGDHANSRGDISVDRLDVFLLANYFRER